MGQRFNKIFRRKLLKELNEYIEFYKERKEYNLKKGYTLSYDWWNTCLKYAEQQKKELFG